MSYLNNYATTWFDNGDHGGVTYHQTNIVSWKDNKVKLNSNGWLTPTTKRKMNQASLQFGLGFKVYQKDFEWFVILKNGKELFFHDNMEFNNED